MPRCARANALTRFTLVDSDVDGKYLPGGRSSSRKMRTRPLCANKTYRISTRPENPAQSSSGSIGGEDSPMNDLTLAFILTHCRVLHIVARSTTSFFPSIKFARNASRRDNNAKSFYVPCGYARQKEKDEGRANNG